MAGTRVTHCFDTAPAASLITYYIGTSHAQHTHLVQRVQMVRRVQRVHMVQKVQTCHTAASLRSPSRSASLVVDSALASLVLETLQQGNLLPVGPMAIDMSTTAIIVLRLKCPKGCLKGCLNACLSVFAVLSACLHGGGRGDIHRG